MPTEVSIKSLLPAASNRQLESPSQTLFNTTFIGIDFGTSTTVVNIAFLDKDKGGIKTEVIWLNQLLPDGRKISAEKIPTVIAWYNEQILVGEGAANLKYELEKGVNIWYSFKMELGEDLGSKYYNSQLGRNSEFTILTPKDAATVFFKYLQAQIDRYVRTHNLPTYIQYAVSIPASFEANQRKELVQALAQNGISINKQALIDEPNAAFLSYVQESATTQKPLLIPDGDNPKLLVFDFGAGTCDISILEIGKNEQGLYSKNLSISKFEKLGGDDIDRYLATHYLFPQLLQQNGLNESDFRTPQKNRIITKLLKAAEQLKINICTQVGLRMNGHLLPPLALDKQNVSLGLTLEIDTAKGLLLLKEPSLTYKEFADTMQVFTSLNASQKAKQKGQDDFISVFNPIHTSLQKANLTLEGIDYVLFIGGSSKNPYIQAALKDYFEHSEILIPRDLQTHVSAGAAIHSLVYNGFNKNIIQPITSEPLLVITKDETPKVILRAGTQIPCDVIVIDDLVTAVDNQPAIELPICLGNKSKMLYNIQIVATNPAGFKRNTPVRLEIEITTDKLLHARATAAEQEVYVEPINPFANKDLTTEERMILKAERQVNIEAEANGGKPTRESLERLHKVYSEVGNDFRAAETLELLNEIYPSPYNYNQIGLLYSSAGYDDKALHYYELGYQNNKNSTTAFNYAYKLKYKDKQKYKRILQESLAMEPDMPHSLFELGRLLENEGDESGTEMVKKAFGIWKKRYDENKMSESDYSWLSSAAERLGMSAFATHVRNSQLTTTIDKPYNEGHLTATNRKEGLTIFKP